MKAAQALTGQALNKLFGQVSGGSFAVIYKDGTTPRYGDGGEPQFTVRFNDDNVLGLIGDDMLTSFGDAYMDGRVDYGVSLARLARGARTADLILQRR